MHSLTAFGDSRLLFWLRVRKFAVPPSMIETATARRAAGDWAGACTAARIDVDFNLRAAARSHGREFAVRVRADLRHLAPDLLRWHMPRIAPDGLLRPGLTISLARYRMQEPDGSNAVHLVARTPPAWADAGQRIGLALWDESRSRDGSGIHPHPHPDRRFRLDLHRHLWDARRASELHERSGAGGLTPDLDPHGVVPQGIGCAVNRWAAEAAILLRSQGRSDGTAILRLNTRHHLVLDVSPTTEESGTPALRISSSTKDYAPSMPVLPAAAIWVPPDVELLRTGMIDADRLHPLVAQALVPGYTPESVPRAEDRAGNSRLVYCRGARHRIGLVNGVLCALDHDPAETRREEMLTALGGMPLPCLQAIDEAHRQPESLVDVRARLDHGDAAGALAVVEDLLGPDVLLRSGALRDELETAALRRITHGLYRAGLAGYGPRPRVGDDRRSDLCARPRRTTYR